MSPTETNGCSSLTAVEGTAARPNMQVLDFDKDSDEFAQFSVAFPKAWDLGTVKFQAFWTGIAATTGVHWAMAGVAITDNESIDTAYGTQGGIDDDSQGSATELLVTAESAAVTIAGTPAAGDLVFFKVFRDIDNGNDDMNGDARLHGVKILYTTDAANDA